ncbi:hypothetical protein [Pararhizobium sp.]|uniref:hypothetical protein n=1 Tax=Pararhizobium sp. TaxID=1977563 RepID=UPI00271E15A7|nr:hypothetical protein [Pararhizobium sp.]MDO9417758.1 hypothetical protein [Pararhizobium sp.]
MPGFEEVQRYLTGLWLLVRNEAEGFAWLDFSLQGTFRSFWAIVWCLPAMAVTWASWRMFYLANMPAGTATGPSFFVKLLLIDLVCWLLPLLLIAAIARPLGFSRALGPIVVATNWLSLPLSYAMVIPAVLRLLISDSEEFTSLLWLLLLVGAIAALFRLLKMITGNQTLLAAAITAIFILPPMMVGDVLQRLLGIIPG